MGWEERFKWKEQHTQRPRFEGEPGHGGLERWCGWSRGGPLRWEKGLRRPRDQIAQGLVGCTEDAWFSWRPWRLLGGDVLT